MPSRCCLLKITMMHLNLLKSCTKILFSRFSGTMYNTYNTFVKMNVLGRSLRGICGPQSRLHQLWLDTLPDVRQWWHNTEGYKVRENIFHWSTEETYNMWMFVICNSECVINSATVQVGTVWRIKQHSNHSLLVDIEMQQLTHTTSWLMYCLDILHAVYQNKQCMLLKHL